MYWAARECKKELDIPEASDIQQRLQYGDNSEKDSVTIVDIWTIVNSLNKLQFSFYWQKYIRCALRKANFIDEAGELKQEVMVDFFADKFDRKQVTEVAEKCSILKGEDLEEKAVLFYDCLLQNKMLEIWGIFQTNRSSKKQHVN